MDEEYKIILKEVIERRMEQVELLAKEFDLEDEVRELQELTGQDRYAIIEILVAQRTKTKLTKIYNCMDFDYDKESKKN